MAGSINNLLIVFSLFFLNSCQNLKQTDNKRVYISVNNNVHYNTDIVDYYIVNRTEKEIEILCNPDFFKREKDSLFINTWFNPKIEIYENKKLIEPGLFSVYYKKKVLDSLNRIENNYIEIINKSILSKTDLRILEKYKLVIKNNDSIKFSTKIDFEGEPRFYDFSEQEGYILKNDKHYKLRICLNENINPSIKKFLEKENIYSKKICSNPVNLIFVKTNYSE